jgi:hypothetical protein
MDWFEKSNIGRSRPFSLKFIRLIKGNRITVNKNRFAKGTRLKLFDSISICWLSAGFNQLQTTWGLQPIRTGQWV